MKEEKPDLGIWLHGDVVSAGEGWVFDPYNAVRYQGYVIGRGVDESVSLDRLQRFMRIYARALLQLNELDW